jgi:HSP20 family protein
MKTLQVKSFLSRGFMNNPLDIMWSSTIDDFINNDNYFDQPDAEIQEFEDYFKLTLQVPGYGKKDLNVNISDNVLYIKGEKQIPLEDYNGKTKYFDTVSFTKTFMIPKNIMAEKTKAKCKNGLLSITLFKEKDKKIIPIKGENKINHVEGHKSWFRGLVENVKNIKWLKKL